MSVSDDVERRFGYLGPNDQIGTLLIVQESKSPSNVIANEPSVVVEIESAAVQALMSQNKVFARNLLGTAGANMTKNAIDGGTSVGAMMGVSYCSGYSPDNGVQRFTNTLTPGGIWKLLGDKMYMLYKYRTRSWDRMLREHFFDWQLEQLLVPLTTIATDLISG